MWLPLQRNNLYNSIYEYVHAYLRDLTPGLKTQTSLTTEINQDEKSKSKMFVDVMPEILKSLRRSLLIEM